VFGEYSIETELQIQNLLLQINQMTVNFFDAAGNPMPLGFNGASMTCQLPHGGSTRIPAVGRNSIGKIGYARIESKYPVAVNAVYRTLDPEGKLVGEAGLQAAPSRFSQFIPVERDVESGLETGIAVVNLASEEQFVHFDLVKENGRKPDFTAGISFTFRAGEQRAFFLSELLDKVPSDFTGTLRITSGHGAAVAVIRTIDGVASSSLPMGSLEP